jgi:prepilin-type N-terminal cleavage/methylation domain-containing protein
VLRWGMRLIARERGFTLIELMIVVMIIGLLSSIAIPNYKRYRDNAKIGRTAAEMRGLSAAFVAYLSATGSYPPDSHLVLPPGMEEFINPAIWANETPLGGHTTGRVRTFIRTQASRFSRRPLRYHTSSRSTI